MPHNLAATDAHARLAADPGAELVDVRTPAEWDTDGIADLGPVGKRVHRIPWQHAAGAPPDPHFTDRLQEAGLGGADQTLFFICRSGVRSLHAAHAAERAGLAARAVNVAAGMEAPDGWKGAGLPWTR